MFLEIRQISLSLVKVKSHPHSLCVVFLLLLSKGQHYRDHLLWYDAIPAHQTWWSFICQIQSLGPPTVSQFYPDDETIQMDINIKVVCVSFMRLGGMTVCVYEGEGPLNILRELPVGNWFRKSEDWKCTSQIERKKNINVH